MRRIFSSFSVLMFVGFAVAALAPGQARAWSGPKLTTLVSFDDTDGQYPYDGEYPYNVTLIADPNGNLFGTTQYGGAYNGGTVFEIAKTATGYANSATTLVSFCALRNCADGAVPQAGLIADANGNLFGTRECPDPC